MTNIPPVLVTGAAGRVGSVGRSVVELLRTRGVSVRALVHSLDERSEYLKSLGAEVVVADLTNGADVVRAMQGCRRVYFGMSVSPPYLEATVIAAAAAKELSDLEVFVNISQMTVSQMTLKEMTDSPQQRQHWLGEQVLNWSRLPVVHVRSTVFMEHFFFSAWAARSIEHDGTIRLPFGAARTSPIAVLDVAKSVAEILCEPARHIGKVYELTGPKSEDMNAVAKQYASALKRPVRYVDVPFEEWQNEFSSEGLPEHVFHHITTMAQLHADNRYDRLTGDVASITGDEPMSIQDFVKTNPSIFQSALVI